jgi:hypothetical protein
VCVHLCNLCNPVKPATRIDRARRVGAPKAVTYPSSTILGNGPP